METRAASGSHSTLSSPRRPLLEPGAVSSIRFVAAADKQVAHRFDSEPSAPVGRLVSGRARQWSLWAPAFSVGAPLRWPADCLPYTVLPTLYTAQSVQHTVYSVQCAPQTVCRCSTAAQCTVLIAECTWPTCSTHNSLAGALLAPHRRRKRKTITLE